MNARMVLCKAVFPVFYLFVLILHLGFHYTYILLLSLLYTIAHLLIPLFPKTKKIHNYKKIFTIYKDNTLLQNACVYILYNNTDYDNINNNVTYLIQRSLCIVTLSL